MTNTNNRVAVKPMQKDELAMAGVVEDLAAAAMNTQAELYDGSQKVLHNWYACRQKDSYELQQLAMRVSKATSPQEAMTAWVDWSQQAVASLSEEIRDQWSLAAKAAANDMLEMKPAKTTPNKTAPNKPVLQSDCSWWCRLEASHEGESGSPGETGCEGKECGKGEVGNPDKACSEDEACNQGKAGSEGETCRNGEAGIRGKVGFEDCCTRSKESAASSKTSKK